MAVNGFATGGGSGLSQTRVFRALPYANYRSVSDWVEEFVDALGGDFDTWWDRFVGGRFETDGLSGRTKLLDLDYAVAEEATTTLATATASPTSAASQDTMLDVLLYLAGIPWPVDGNWTTQQKREMVRVGWDALRYKGTRKRLLKLVGAAANGIIHGASLPPFAFSFIHGDCYPSPGADSTYTARAVAQAGTVATTSGSATVTGTGTAFVTDGSWNGLIIVIDNIEYWVSSVTNATSLTLTGNAVSTLSGKAFSIVYPASTRPWLLEATDNLTRRIFPSWAAKGVGYSQFRAGFSGAGEPVMPDGARLNILVNGNFDNFTYPTNPDSWSISGSLTPSRATCNSSPTPQINHEFTTYCAQIDMSSASAGDDCYLSQSTTAVNNQVAHRLVVEYGYTNTQDVSVLAVQVRDLIQSSTYYWPGEATLQAGTISVVEGSKTVTGTGTAFDTTGLWSGMPLTSAAGRLFLIDHVVSETELVLRDAPLFDESDTAFSVQAWTTTETSIVLDPGSSAVERLAYELDVYPLRGSSSADIRGSSSIQVKIGAACDGTSTTKVVYSFYHIGFYEKHDPVIEDDATGERTLWIPLRDALGWVQFASGVSSTTLENANSDRSAWRSRSSSSIGSAYHPAIGRRGYRNSSTWTNAITQSNTFSSWTLSNVTNTGTTTSPDLAGTLTAGNFQINSVTNTAERSSGTTAASKSWLYGVWANAITGDPGYQTGTITITAGSTSVAGSGTAFDTTGAWSNVEIMTESGYRYKISSAGGLTSMTLAAASGRTETAVRYKIADFKVSLLYGTTEGDSNSFFRSGSDGWTLLACPAATLGAVAGNVGIRVRYLGRNSGSQYALSAAYAYDVTGKTDVLYPPVAISAATAGTVAATRLDAITDSVGTNVKHKLLQTTLMSVSRGVLGLTVVPMFGAGSQPDATILDVCESATANRLRLHIASGAIKLTRVNNAGTSTSMSLTLTTSDEPTSTQATWKRDTAIAIRIRWDDDGKASMSVGSSNVAASLSAAPYTDTSVDTLRIGASEAGTGNFDGIITDLEVCQVGTPTT